MTKLFVVSSPANLLSLLPEKAFLTSIYIGGYRNNDNREYLQYTSDTNGIYNEVLGTGPLDQISIHQNLKSC